MPPDEDKPIIEEVRETLDMEDDDILIIQSPFKPEDVLKNHLQKDASTMSLKQLLADEKKSSTEKQLNTNECNTESCSRDIEVFTIGNGRKAGYCMSHGITMFREYSYIESIEKKDDSN